ncbi:MAG TPA: DUF2231 domain-containing protein [Rugosimonospora sp.]|jgi:hypothetical protein
MDVFETFFGLPLHPLVIHAAVVFIPLLIVGALGYVLVPRLRPRIDWAVVVLAVIAPLSALLAKLSGDAFRARMASRHLATPAILGKIDVHRHFGTITLYVTIALGLVALAAVLVPSLRQRTPAVVVPLAVVTIGLSVATAYYVFRTGDTAAHIVWQGY